MTTGRSVVAACLALALWSAAGTPAQAQAGRPLTVDSTVGELLDNPAAMAVLRTEVPILVGNPQIKAAAALPLRALAHYAPTVLTEAKLTAINAALTRAPGAVSSGRAVAAATMLDPREALTLRTMPLWDGPAPGALGTRPQDVPTLTVITPGETTSFGTAVIVAPGGGYQALASSLEGRQVADWFAAHGVTAFVLTYRLTPFGYGHPTQLTDAKRAIRWVRAHAGDYGVDPSRIGMIGFSAGGHLTAMAETQFDGGDGSAADPVERVSSRPDFAVLGYAAIALSDNRWNSRGLIGPKTPPAALPQLNPAAHVRADTPPTFLWATTTDELVPSTNATLMYDALIAAKVPAELHIFAKGRHGMGLGMTDPALSVWPTLLQNWLDGLGMIGAHVGVGK
ncbi:alpha/beta hydrolase [Novosphingobium sp.]|uniref:alpha/beta hydrolase n=1 Tax=Novosphingobium sp. TaxID=1874826 RepID=UPI003B52EABE